MRSSSPKYSSLPPVYPKGVGEYMSFLHTFPPYVGYSIVEFASQEDAQRAIRELSESPLLGRPIFIREVSIYFICSSMFLKFLQDRETEARFGATPVPGKIGMAMAGQGFNAQPPPRPPHHNAWAGGGSAGGPGNQLYVGNVSVIHFSLNRDINPLLLMFSCHTKPVGKI